MRVVVIVVIRVFIVVCSFAASDVQPRGHLQGRARWLEMLNDRGSLDARRAVRVTCTCTYDADRDDTRTTRQRTAAAYVSIVFFSAPVLRYQQFDRAIFASSPSVSICTSACTSSTLVRSSSDADHIVMRPWRSSSCDASACPASI